MNKYKSIAILAIAVLLSAFSNIKTSVCESINTRIDRDKLLEKDRSFIYAKNITHQLIGSKITTKFAPKNSFGQAIDLDRLALDLGYDHFNWVNYVERDPYGITDRGGQQLSTPYNDPPKGGYHYDSADSLPFYWDLVNCDRCKPRHHRKHFHNLKQSELIFQDSPADYRLQPGEAVEFITSLVGVKKYDVTKHTAEWEVLYTFRWRLTNPHPNYSQVSLVQTDVAWHELSPLLLNAMRLDGVITDYLSLSPNGD